MIEQQIIKEGVIEEPKEDIIKGLYFRKLIKSIDYHFLSQSQLNQVERPDWMTLFFEDLLKENLDFFLEIRLSPETTTHFTIKFLETYLLKLGERFTQDSELFLEHDSLFTNFLSCLNDHNLKIRGILSEREIEIDLENIYDLSVIYKESKKHLKKIISDEINEFDAVIFKVKIFFPLFNF